MNPTPPSLEELLDGLPKIELFAIFMQPTDAFRGPFASPEGRRLLTEHLLYLFELQRIGTLYASGPLDLDIDGIKGMCIVHAESVEDAHRIAHAEPYHKAGWRENTVRSWQLNEGLLVEPVKSLTGLPHPPVASEDRMPR